uniref:Uncharacterized protein n=1 Tax=Glossina austeni TaxID=7395 RepID=A0A1A9UGQ9_GLOAU
MVRSQVICIYISITSIKSPIKVRLCIDLLWLKAVEAVEAVEKEEEWRAKLGNRQAIINVAVNLMGHVHNNDTQNQYQQRYERISQYCSTTNTWDVQKL